VGVGECLQRQYLFQERTALLATSEIRDDVVSTAVGKAEIFVSFFVYLTPRKLVTAALCLTDLFKFQINH
jgi:hypothetical protein